MNRYQLQVADFDRKARWRLRLLTLLGISALIVLAFWSAGFPRSGWLGSTFGSKPKASQSLSEARRRNESVPPASEEVRPARLRLVSTRPGRNALEGGTAEFAIDGQALTYGIGALLAGGAILREIYDDRVVLGKHTRLITLYVEGVAADPTTKRTEDLHSQLLLQEDETPNGLQLPSLPPPPTYTDLMRAAPRFEDGKIVGFVVYPGSNAALFAQMELQPGDVLLAVDGRQLQDATELHRALKVLSEGAIVTADIRRGADVVTTTLGAPGDATEGSHVASAARIN